MPPVGVAHDVCAGCLATTHKLCERCKPSILPQLAKNLGWLRLMGAARAEQKALQDAEDAAVEKAKRRTARKHTRRGIAGLLVHIRTAA